MTYKGNDLDLRSAPTAPPAAASGRERGADSDGGPAAKEPIAVDDLVLACCNCAHDVARFHASPDVRLEHLLHALTRVPAAADLLAALGIQIDRLRRDTAVAIAAAMPAGPLADVAAPSASAALEDVLRRAADVARARRSSASVHDLLRTLLRGGPESPATMLLMRAATDPHQLERWRDEPSPEEVASLATAPPQPTDVPPALADALNARLDRLEASVHGLSAAAAADRKTIVQSLLVVQSELQALRAEREHALPEPKAPAGDGALEAKLGEIGHGMAALGERLAAVDKLAGGDSRPEVLERLVAIEGRIGDQTKRIAAALSETLADALPNTLSGRLDQAEAALQHLSAELERHTSSTGERHIALEASVRAQLQGAEEASKTHERDLAEIYEALVKLGTNQRTLGDNLGTWRVENSGDVGIISNRLQQLEQTSLELLSRLGDEVVALRRESLEEGPRRSNGFKRWLYGTSHVLSTGWREDANSRPLDHSRTDEKS